MNCVLWIMEESRPVGRPRSGESSPVKIATTKIPRSDWEALKADCEERGMKFGAYLALVLKREVGRVGKHKESV